MNCHHCSNVIKIRTDPEHRDYKIESGARRAIDTWESSEQGTLELMDDEDREKLREDPFKMLEHKQKDKVFHSALYHVVLNFHRKLERRNKISCNNL